MEGRLLRDHGLLGGERPWFWGVEFHQARAPFDGFLPHEVLSASQGGPTGRFLVKSFLPFPVEFGLRP